MAALQECATGFRVGDNPILTNNTRGKKMTSKQYLKLDLWNGLKELLGKSRYSICTRIIIKRVGRQNWRGKYDINWAR